MIHINPQWPKALFEHNPKMGSRGMLAQCKVLTVDDFLSKKIVHYFDGCGDLVVETFEKNTEKINAYIHNLVKCGVCGSDGNIYTVKNMSVDDAWQVLRVAALYHNRESAARAMAIINNN